MLAKQIDKNNRREKIFPAKDGQKNKKNIR